MEPARISYRIYQGSTFKETLRWESETKQYATISGITKAAPCVITTASTHSIPLNWRIRVTGVTGMKDINLASTTDYYLVTSKTTNRIPISFTNSSLKIGFCEKRAEYSLYLFSKENLIRKFCTYLTNQMWFENITFLLL